MNRSTLLRWTIRSMPALVLAGCVSLPQPEPADRLWQWQAPASAQAHAGLANVRLQIAPPQAAPGYQGPGMAYRRQSDALNYYARNRWLAPPQQMLYVELLSGLQARFPAAGITDAGSAALADFRLEVELRELVQDFRGDSPSKLRLRVQATLVQLDGRAMVASRRFRITVPCHQESPAGGVRAAGHALARLLDELALWLPQALGDAHTAGRPAAIPHRGYGLTRNRDSAHLVTFLHWRTSNVQRGSSRPMERGGENEAHQRY